MGSQSTSVPHPSSYVVWLGRGNRLLVRPSVRLSVVLLMVVAILPVGSGFVAARAEAASHLDSHGRYVALGDSFSSGEGIPPFQAPTDTEKNQCHRSLDAYPELVMGDLVSYSSVDFWACSGSKIADLYALEMSDRPPWNDPTLDLGMGEPAKSAIDRLGPDVTLVTLTIGGNDIDFGEIIGECVNPFVNCEDLNDTTIRKITDLEVASPTLSQLYGDIRRAIAPGGRVLVLGYPRLFPDPPVDGCLSLDIRDGFPMSESEQAWANDIAGRLNERIRRSTQLVSGVEYVDVEDALTGGELCGGFLAPRYINGLVDLLNLDGQRVWSFHPNRDGQRLLGNIVVNHLQGERVALFNPANGQWHLRDGGNPVDPFYYGNPGDTPLIGDWDCDGIETVAMYRESAGFMYLRNTNDFGAADISYFFGSPGDLPISGDWNGNGCDTVSIYRPSQGKVYVINTLGTAVADFSYWFGNPGDRPFAGDFDGDGIDTVGLYRQSSGFAYLTNTTPAGYGVAPTDRSFFYGNPSDRIMAADWDGDGDETVGIFRPDGQRFYLSNENESGVADIVFDFGESGWLPVAGDFWNPTGRRLLG